MIKTGKNHILSATALGTLGALAAIVGIGAASVPTAAADQAAQASNGPAQASNGPAQASDGPAQASDGPAIEEIIVTSQRRRQRLQDVPLSVTALGGDFLVDNDIHTLQDLSGTVPGFVTTDSVSYSAAPLSIRGIGGANGGGNFFADEPVAVYSDGVYIGRLSFSTADLLDIASIEVLRGPQGTLYGRNSTAGALLVKSARPTDSFEGYLSGSYGSIEDKKITGVLSGPVVEGKLNARAAFQYSDRNGFGTNTFDGSDIGGSRDISGRLSLQFTPTATLTVDLIGEYLDRKANPATLQVADMSNPVAASPFVRRPDFQQVLNKNQFAINDPNFVDSETTSLSIAVNWDLGWASVESQSSYRKFDLDGAQDSDGTAATLFNNNGSLRNEQFTQEFRLTSNEGSRLTWIAGAFYIHEKNAMNPFLIRNFNALFRLGTLAEFRAFQNLDAVAVFADATYNLTDRLALSVGGRYSYEQKDFNNDLLVTILNGGTVPAFVPGLGGVTLPAGFVFSDPPKFTASKSFNDFSPRAVLTFKVTDNLMTYFNFSQGFKSGGFNAFGLAPSFGPENVNALEAGFKSDLANGRLRFNAAGFYYDYTNLQVRLPVPTGGVNIQNAAKARVSGFEVEASAAPVEGLKLTGNIAYLDSTFKRGVLPSVPNDTTFPIGSPIPLVSEDITGNDLSRAPKWQLYVSGEYSFPVGATATARLLASWRYQDNVFFLETNQNQDTFSSGSWNEVDLRVSLSSNDDLWEAALFARNIFDDRHVTHITALGSFPNATINAPSRWGGQITRRF